MPTVNMHEAKTALSKLVAEIESGVEQEIIIARNGKPVARLVPIDEAQLQPRRLGLADGQFGEFDYEAFQALDKVVQDTMESRWEKFERFTRELDEKYGKKKRKKTA